jgi:hypothetical protein
VRCRRTKITTRIPGIIVKTPAAERIGTLALKILDTLDMIASIGLTSIVVNALERMTSVQENKKQKKEVTAIIGAISGSRISQK